MNQPPGIYSKITREGALILGIVWLAFQFAEKAGLSAPPPRQMLLDHELERQFDRGVAAVETNRRLLEDLHAGIAPRDQSMTPQWSALRSELNSVNQSLAALARALDKNTESNYYRYSDPPPPTVREAQTQVQRQQDAPQEPSSWLDRLAEWLRWDSAG